MAGMGLSLTFQCSLIPMRVLGFITTKSLNPFENKMSSFIYFLCNSNKFLYVKGICF